MGSGERSKRPSGVQRRAPLAKAVLYICIPEKVPGGNNYGEFRLQKHVGLKPKAVVSGPRYLVAYVDTNGKIAYGYIITGCS